MGQPLFKSLVVVAPVVGASLLDAYAPIVVGSFVSVKPPISSSSAFSSVITSVSESLTSGTSSSSTERLEDRQSKRIAKGYGFIKNGIFLHNFVYFKNKLKSSILKLMYMLVVECGSGGGGSDDLFVSLFSLSFLIVLLFFLAKNLSRIGLLTI